VSYSYTTSTTFTRTEARYLASKVAADLHQCRRRYGRPATEEAVANYVTELEEQLVGGYVSTYEFGFVDENRRRVVSWSYRVTAAGLAGGADDRPGGVYLAAQVASAQWFNYLTRTEAWWTLGEAGRAQMNARLPFVRTPADSPTDGDGYWVEDRTYSAGGVSMPRRTFRPY
jgi:hypothetical protein